MWLMSGRRFVLFAFAVALLLSACGSDEVSPTEYVAGLNELVAVAASDLNGSLDVYEAITDPTIEDWATFVERELAIRRVFVEDFGELDPPGSIVDVHQIFGEALDRGLAATEALAAVTDTVEDPDEAQQTPEFAEYLAANADGSTRVCQEAQAKLDALATSSELLADEPWLPDLGLTMRAAFGCLG
jgi:hypothetical protein